MTEVRDTGAAVRSESPYEALGVSPVVNCMGAVTFLGGLPLRPAAVDAMRRASSSKVNLFDLNAAVGRAIAAVCRTEAAFVTSGATGGLLLAAAAAITRGAVDRVARLPDLDSSSRPEIVLHRKHRLTFDHALRNTGARLVEFGYSSDRTELWELEAALTDRTAAVFYVSRFGPSSVLSLEEVVDVAHRAGVPVIVDAAVALPPRANLWEIPATGADLTCFSGGKAIGGPQNTGFVAGRGDLVEWCAANATPNHNTIGRPAKVNAEAMVGLLAALEAYVEQDEAEEYAAWMSMLERIESIVSAVGIAATIRPTSKNEMPIPTIRFSTPGALNAERIALELRTVQPPIWLLHDGHDLVIDPHALRAEDVEHVGQSVAQLLRAVLTKEDS